MAQGPTQGGRGGLSRRGMLKAGGGAAFAGVSLAALKLPFFATDGVEQDPAECRAEDLSATQKKLIVSNWPQYIDEDEGDGTTLKTFEQRTGIKVTYNDDVNDNAEFYSKVRNQLGGCEPIKRDLMVLTDWMAARMIGLGWVQPMDPKKIPNVEKNLIDPLRNRQWDPDQTYHAPWQTGLTGIAYNAAKTKEVKSFEELLTRPDLKGRVTLLSEMRDTMAFMLKVIGADPDKFTDAEWQAGDRPAPEGRQVGPDPGLHRQRVHAGPRRRQHPGVRGLVRRRDPAPVRQPRHQVRRARGGPVPLERQHARPQPRGAPVERRGVGQLLLRACGRGAARGLGELHLSGQGRQGGDGRRSIPPWPRTS